MKTRLGVVAVAAIVLPAAVARAERPRIAVMEIGSPKVTADLRERVTHAVHEGLLASGADVVDGMPAAATGPGGAPCEGNGCVTAVAKATVSGYVVRGTLEVDGRTYELRLEMLDGKTGDLIDSREDRCEICTEGEALEMAGVSASALKVQAFKKKTAMAAPPEAAAPAPKTVLEATPPGAANVETSSRVVSGPRVTSEEHRELGWIGVGVGAMAGVVGWKLIDLDGKGTCSDGPNQCPHLYDTKGWGIATLVGGAAAIAAGVLVLTGKF
ncbi:MAG TPA: hypothetical protein VHL80_08410 [Polyangia bacterium]|nr:hypothetical protein [Polyangia bacterium]